MRAFVLAALLLAGCTATPDPPVGDEAAGSGPDWSFTDTEGIVHSRNSTLGEPAVLFWMASWCPTCKSKTPALRAVHADYADRNVSFYTVSFDATDDDATLDEWKRTYQQPWPHGVDPDFSMARTFGVRSQSSVVVLDAKGGPFSSYGYGRVTEAALREDLDRALSQP